GMAKSVMPEMWGALLPGSVASMIGPGVVTGKTSVTPAETELATTSVRGGLAVASVPVSAQTRLTWPAGTRPSAEPWLIAMLTWALRWGPKFPLSLTLIGPVKVSAPSEDMNNSTRLGL